MVVDKMWLFLWLFGVLIHLCISHCLRCGSGYSRTTHHCLSLKDKQKSRVVTLVVNCKCGESGIEGVGMSGGEDDVIK